MTPFIRRFFAILARFLLIALSCYSFASEEKQGIIWDASETPRVQPLPKEVAADAPEAARRSSKAQPRSKSGQAA